MVSQVASGFQTCLINSWLYEVGCLAEHSNMGQHCFKSAWAMKKNEHIMSSAETELAFRYSMILNNSS